MKRKYLVFTFILSVFLLHAQKDTFLIKQLLDTAFVYERSDYEKSVNSAKQALQLSEKNNYAIGISGAKRQIGLVYYNKGEFDKAISEFISAIRIADSCKLYGEQARAHLHIGLVYLDLKKDTLAMYYFRKGKEICEKNHIERGLPSFLTNIGIMHNVMGNTDSALFYYESTRDYYTKSENIYGLASIENNIGNVYKTRGEFIKARGHYLAGLKYTKQMNDMYAAVCYGNIAEIDGRLKNYTSAVKYIDSAIVTAQSFGAKKDVLDLFVKKQLILEEKGDLRGSLDCYEQIISLKDSLLGEEVENKVVEMQTKYDTEKKEAENRLLKQENELNQLKIETNERKNIFFTIGIGLLLLLLGAVFYAYRTKIKSNKKLSEQNEQINRQNTTLKSLNLQLIESEEALQRSDSAKDKLLSVISHDVSNPVKALANYTGAILSENTKHGKEELLTALGKVNNTVVPLQNMLANLLNWSQVQKTGFLPNKKKLLLDELVQECIFVYKAAASEKNISVNVFIPKDAEIMADKEMMLIIIRNLLSNALKFSPRQSNINITFSNNILGICDKGIGMNSELKELILNGKNRSSATGTEQEKGIGMGLQLVEECIKAQGFSWEIESEKGKGACFKIHPAA